MKKVKKAKSINGIKNLLKVEKEKSLKNEDYLPSTELDLLSKEELELLSEDVINLKNEIKNSFLLISSGLGYQVNENIKSYPNTKSILKALSSKLNHKCRYFISTKQLSFDFKGDADLMESEESGILIMLGVFACLRINLEYLELRNPELKTMSEMLHILYPEAKQAYDEVSKKFGFNNTVFVGLTWDSPEELFERLKAMKLESWNQGDMCNNSLSNNIHLN